MGSCISLNNDEEAAQDAKVQIQRMCRSEEDHIKKIYRSDEDRGRYVAEPDIDKKAEIFINGFHKKNRVVDDEGRDHPQASLPHAEFLKPL